MITGGILKMVDCEDRYFECPVCGFAIKFRYDYIAGNYTSLCPYCEGKLTIEKNEFEQDRLEIYFEPEEGIF